MAQKKINKFFPKIKKKLSNKYIKRVIIFLIILVIIFNLSFAIYARPDKYFSFNFWNRYPALKQAYLDSQYVNKHPKGWIPDEVVNSYAGGAYIKGTSPILIAPDTPPLGRYIIGLSEIIFNNENILPFLLTLGSLYMLYLVGMQSLSKPLLALIAPLLTSFEPLFSNQLIYAPLLDVMQLFFLLCSFYFFNKGVSTKTKEIIYFCIASIFLGFFISTKFYITGITIIAAWVLTLLFLKRIKDTFILLITLPLAIFILLLSYVRVLFDHYTILKFLGIQKYVFLYHKSQLIYPFSVWDLLLFNKWHVWWGNIPILSDSQWRPTWPVLTVITFITALLMKLKKINFSFSLISLILWAISYLLFFSVGQIASRYFIILIPVLYIIAVYGVYEAVLVFRKYKYI